VGAALLLLDAVLRQAEHVLAIAYPHLATTDGRDGDAHRSAEVLVVEDLAHLVMALRDTIGRYHDACGPDRRNDG